MTLSGRFVCCWVSRDIATLGNGIFIIGLLAWIYHLEESTSLVAIIVLALLFPSFILSPVAERLISGNRAYPAALVAHCAAILSLLPLLRVKAASDLPLTLGMVLVLGISAAFIKASRRMLLASLIGENTATPDTIMAATRLATMVAAPAAGTAIYNISKYGTAGFPSCVTAAAIVLALSTGLLFFARPTNPLRHPLETSSIAKQLAEIQKGLVYVWRQPTLRTAASFKVISALLLGGLIVVQVALMVWGAFTSADSIGLVLAAQGFGIAIVVFGDRFLRGQLPIHSRIAIGFGLTSAGGFGFAITDSLNGSIISALVTGFGIGMSGLALTFLIDKLAAEEDASPVWRGLDLVNNAAVILSVTFIGRITDHVGPRYTIVLFAILFAVLALYSFGAAPDLGPEEGDKESTHSVADSLYDIECGVPTNTLLG